MDKIIARVAAQNDRSYTLREMAASLYVDMREGRRYRSERRPRRPDGSHAGS